MREDDKFVLDLIDLNLLSSTRQLLKEKKAEAKVKDALLVGFPNYGDKGLVTPLPGTEAELRGIAAVLSQYEHQIILLQEDQASETLLKNKAKNPSLFHIATHGFFLEDVEVEENSFILGVASHKAQENPLLRAGLMLKDAEKALDDNRPEELGSADNGILTAYEVSTLPLEGTELVVLSACETGLGEVRAGEGVYGLQRAFQIAGADALVMSLWKVSDDATQLLMQYFYQQWMQTGSKEKAFQQAQRKLKERYPNPYYWGAFVLLQ